MLNLSESMSRFSGHRYHVYNDWAKQTYGGRLQKVSIDAGFTCPNRDGSLGVGGCSFCNNEGFSPSYLREQPEIHTRPDCLSDETLDYLAELAARTLVELEIGIESCNDSVLQQCLRGHSFACTQEAIGRAAKRGLFITGHLLLGLPHETRESLIVGARALSYLPLDALKFHQLQIVRGTRLANQYRADPSSIDMLEVLPPHIKIQRLGSEVPPDVLVSPDWGMRLHKFPAMLEARLQTRETWQGRLFTAPIQSN
ncbi:MAG: radical SAM protein [Deltaproteobacteria bacterium]|nr:radical SAM protein [Deltaproteobacteria bacterium]